MSICSYCDIDEALTREHLIPDWYTRIDPSPGDVRFLERAKTRLLKSDAKIKDVCAECNNKHLPELDAYGKELYLRTLRNPIYAGEKVRLQVDYERFVKWLLKISFNSARVHKTDLEIFSSYRKLLIDKTPLPPELQVHVNVIAPWVEAPDGNPAIARRDQESAATPPQWFRVGVFRAPAYDTMYWALRQVAIDSFVFFLFIPDLRTSEWRRDEKDLFAAATRAPFGYRLAQDGSTAEITPGIDALRYGAAHISQFPFSHGVVKHEMYEKLISGEIETIVWVIPREDIEANNLTPHLEFIRDIQSSREAAMSVCGKVEFSVLGYEDDPRELFEIQEVRAFLRQLDQQFSAWMFYQWENGKWLKALALCLVDCTRKGQSLEVDPEQMSALTTRWFHGLNELGHKIALTNQVNRNLSFAAMRILTDGEFGSTPGSAV